MRCGPPHLVRRLGSRYYRMSFITHVINVCDNSELVNRLRSEAREGHRMGRPKLPETMMTVSVRLANAMVEEIDDYMAYLQKQMPRLNINRADAVRKLLAIGLETEEKKTKSGRQRN